MTHLHLSQLVEAPLETTFDTFSRFEVYPEFMSAVELVTRDDEDRNRVSWTFSMAGFIRRYTTEVDVDAAAHRLRWHSTSGPRHSGSAELTADGDGRTRIDMDVDSRPAGLLEKLGDTLGVVERRVRRDLRQFARYVESDGRAAPTGRRVAASDSPDDRGRTASEWISDRIEHKPTS